MIHRRTPFRGSTRRQLAQTPPGFDPEHVINANEANLADYLNQPVHDILSRLGLPRLPAPAPPPDASDAETPPGAANPVDPSQMIKPATDALGTLGTGQFNNADPTQMFQGIAQALESAADPLQQAISGLGSVWQGAAASSAGATTNAALSDGADVASQSTSLGESLSTVTASVRQAEARLIAIINEFWAKIAAIGPNIIFPWGIAQAIQAAFEAVTDTAEVMTETQGTMAAQAASVAAVGAPVAMTAATPSLAAQSFAPLLQMATGLTSPVMEGVSAATQAAPISPGHRPRRGLPARERGRADRWPVVLRALRHWTNRRPVVPEGLRPGACLVAPYNHGWVRRCCRGQRRCLPPQSTVGETTQAGTSKVGATGMGARSDGRWWTHGRCGQSGCRRSVQRRVIPPYIERSDRRRPRRRSPAGDRTSRSNHATRCRIENLAREFHDAEQFRIRHAARRGH